MLPSVGIALLDGDMGAARPAVEPAWTHDGVGRTAETAFCGSLPGHNPPSPVVGLGAYRGTGYYLSTSAGDVYNYGIFLPGSPIGLPLPASIDEVGAR